MKKAAVLALVLAACLAAAWGDEVKVQANTPFTYACLECSGSYAQIPAKVEEFIGEFFKQGLMPAGAMIGLYLNSPAEVKSEAELKWQIGFPVAADAKVAEPLKKCEYKYTLVAYYLHKGPVEKVAESYGKITQFLEANGYKVAGPCLERYLDNPQMVKPEEMRTEILFPVEKK